MVVTVPDLVQVLGDDWHHLNKMSYIQVLQYPMLLAIFDFQTQAPALNKEVRDYKSCAALLVKFCFV